MCDTQEEMPVYICEWVHLLRNIMKTWFLLSPEACNSSHADIWVYFSEEWPENACLRKSLRDKDKGEPGERMAIKCHLNVPFLSEQILGYYK